MDAAESSPGHRRLPAHATPLRLLGVDYVHLPTSDGGDLYVTWHGIHLIDQLRPRNWHEREWFRRHSIPLPGTGTVYRVTTRSMHGRAADLVVKYSRVGQDVPMDTRTLVRFAGVEFNTPYEEFSRVMDLRSRPQGPRMLTHRPLGIYVPAARMALWESGRSESRIARKKARYFDVELDILRQYVLIYEWIDGIGADEAFPGLERKQRRRVVEELTERARRDIPRGGLCVRPCREHAGTSVGRRPRSRPIRLFSSGTMAAHARKDPLGDRKYALHPLERQHPSRVEGLARGREMRRGNGIQQPLRGSRTGAGSLEPGNSRRRTASDLHDWPRIPARRALRVRPAPLRCASENRDGERAADLPP